jgi:hypothetical protein
LTSDVRRPSRSAPIGTFTFEGRTLPLYAVEQFDVNGRIYTDVQTSEGFRRFVDCEVDEVHFGPGKVRPNR